MRDQWRLFFLGIALTCSLSQGACELELVAFGGDGSALIDELEKLRGQDLDERQWKFLEGLNDRSMSESEVTALWQVVDSLPRSSRKKQLISQLPVLVMPERRARKSKAIVPEAPPDPIYPNGIHRRRPHSYGP